MSIFSDLISTVQEFIGGNSDITENIGGIVDSVTSAKDDALSSVTNVAQTAIDAKDGAIDSATNGISDIKNNQK